MRFYKCQPHAAEFYCIEIDLLIYKSTSSQFLWIFLIDFKEKVKIHTKKTQLNILLLNLLWITLKKEKTIIKNKKAVYSPYQFPAASVSMLSWTPVSLLGSNDEVACWHVTALAVTCINTSSMEPGQQNCILTTGYLNPQREIINRIHTKIKIHMIWCEFLLWISLQILDWIYCRIFCNKSNPCWPGLTVYEPGISYPLVIG